MDALGAPGPAAGIEVVLLTDGSPATAMLCWWVLQKICFGWLNSLEPKRFVILRSAVVAGF